MLAGGAKSRTPGASTMAELLPASQAVPAGGGRCVAALGVARELGRLRRRRGRKRVDDGGFADARLADEQRRAACQRLGQVGDAGSGLTGHFPAGKAQGAIRRQFGLEGGGAEVRFIDDQQGRDVLQMRARPVAIDQEPVRSGFRGHHDGEAVDVRGNRLGAAPRIDALDQVAARFDRFHGGSIGAGRERPADPVAAHHPLLASFEGAMQGDHPRPAPARRVRSSRAPRRCRACLSIASL